MPCMVGCATSYCTTAPTPPRCLFTGTKQILTSSASTTAVHSNVFHTLCFIFYFSVARSAAEAGTGADWLARPARSVASVACHFLLYSIGTRSLWAATMKSFMLKPFKACVKNEIVTVFQSVIAKLGWCCSRREQKAGQRENSASASRLNSPPCVQQGHRKR